MELLERIRQFQALLEADPARKLDTWLDLESSRRAEVLSEIPVPFCCPMIAGARVVRPLCREPDFSDSPQWRAPYRVSGNGYSSVVVKVCPFCATPLPGLVLKAVPPPKVAVTDGYSCKVCDERVGSCLCSHPLSIYEAEGAPPIFAVTALFRKGKEVLSVSRKNNPHDKGFPGGKIDPGETPREALVREVREETGLSIHEFHPVFDATDSTGKRCLTYEVTSHSGELSTKEAGVVEWVPLHAMMAPGLTFEGYNRALIHHTDPYNRYL